MNAGNTIPDFELLCSPWISLEQKSLWNSVLPLAQCRLHQKNDIIIEAGEKLDHLYYLKKGKIKTVALNSSGQQKIMWYIESGCIFGETPLFNQKPCDYYFYAVEDCEVYLFGRDIIIQDIFPRYPDLVMCLINTLARKVHILSTQVEGSTFYKPVVRVSKLIYLLYHDKKLTAKKNDCSLPITQEDIAEILGIHRVTVNNAVRQLKSLDILESGTHFIVVKDADKLQNFISRFY